MQQEKENLCIICLEEDISVLDTQCCSCKIHIECMDHYGL